MRRRTLVAGLVITAALGTYAMLRVPEGPHASIAPSRAPAAASSAAAQQRAARVARMMLENPALDSDSAGKLADESDRLKARLEEMGEPDVRRMLRDTRVGEAEARAYFAEHRAVFGGRSFEASRLSIDRLVAIERVKARLDLE
jgi:hypothetical protein